MRGGVGFIAAVAGSLLIGILTPATASAAADTTPPALTLQPAAFLQGGQIGASTKVNGDSTSYFTYGIPMYTTWRGSDASGICGYDVLKEPVGGEPYPAILGTPRTRYDGETHDYNGDFGGGAAVVGAWHVVARDCAGNTTQLGTSVGARVTQEDGTDLYGSPSNVKVSYAGTWGTSSCTCWSHGTVRRTTQQGASATINVYARAGRPIALVMERAPNRGRFTLFVDGVNRGTIDTLAPTATHRVIVWAGKVNFTGNHVVRLVNQATVGRPRIDLDAVLTVG